MLSLWISPSLASVTTSQYTIAQFIYVFHCLNSFTFLQSLFLFSKEPPDPTLDEFMCESVMYTYSVHEYIFQSEVTLRSQTLKVKKLQPKLAFIDEVQTERPFCCFCVKINNHWMFLSCTFECGIEKNILDDIFM
ncbi:hypothetical protein V8G54_020350 [Vigna mungo]|uniref:Uncharacterized protein n=1 Tax=Vigna mungo TaxID=3915 RepID=A0AAQ3NBP4_VIGMU